MPPSGMSQASDDSQRTMAYGDDEPETLPLRLMSELIQISLEEWTLDELSDFYNDFDALEQLRLGDLSDYDRERYENDYNAIEEFIYDTLETLSEKEPVLLTYNELVFENMCIVKERHATSVYSDRPTEIFRELRRRGIRVNE